MSYVNSPQENGVRSGRNRLGERLGGNGISPSSSDIESSTANNLSMIRIRDEWSSKDNIKLMLSYVGKFWWKYQDYAIVFVGIVNDQYYNKSYYNENVVITNNWK